MQDDGDEDAAEAGATGQAAAKRAEVARAEVARARVHVAAQKDAALAAGGTPSEAEAARMVAEFHAKGGRVTVCPPAEETPARRRGRPRRGPLTPPLTPGEPGTGTPHVDIRFDGEAARAWRAGPRGWTADPDDAGGGPPRSLQGRPRGLHRVGIGAGLRRRLAGEGRGEGLRRAGGRDGMLRGHGSALH